MAKKNAISVRRKITKLKVVGFHGSPKTTLRQHLADLTHIDKQIDGDRVASKEWLNSVAPKKRIAAKPKRRSAMKAARRARS